MNKSWKRWETWVCKLFGGKRRGADYADKDGGKNDCINTKGWSIETKYMKSPSYKIMLDDALKARNRASENEIPIAVIRKKAKGISKLDGTLVCMTLRDFLEWFS